MSLAGGYLLLIFPLAIMLYLRVGMLKQTAVAVLRMTVQLLFVGLYLQVVFQLNNAFLNLAWVAAMILVADLSILKGCRLKLKRFLLPMFSALLVGTALPMIFFAGIILRLPGWFDAQYVIPNQVSDRHHDRHFFRHCRHRVSGHPVDGHKQL